MAEILDSGNRREFEGGAVRDIAEGKGRCDLMPLLMIASYFNREGNDKAGIVCQILDCLNDVLISADDDFISPIMTAIDAFVCQQYEGRAGLAFLELAKHYEGGAVKYGERNWEKGIPAHCYIDSCVRHLLKWYDGWNDEPHDRAIIWNLLGLAWTLVNKPMYDDRPKFNTEEQQ